MQMKLSWNSNRDWPKSAVVPIRWAGIDMEEVLRDFPGHRVAFVVQYVGLPLTLARLWLVYLQYTPYSG
jgi:hypothetical protein